MTNAMQRSALRVVEIPQPVKKLFAFPDSNFIDSRKVEMRLVAFLSPTFSMRCSSVSIFRFLCTSNRHHGVCETCDSR
jgi:hypothetical protein